MDFDENRSKRNNIPGTSSEPTEPSNNKSNNNKGVIIGIAAVAGIIVLGFLAWWLFMKSPSAEEAEEGISKEEKQQIELEQQLAASELENATKDLQSLEGQRDLIINDTLKMRLTQQYEAARTEIEKLQEQLKNNKNKSSKEIAQLRAEIDKLRALLKHYLEEIARLNKENEELRAENEQIKSENQQLSSNLANTTAQNQVLNERMTLAEKINVTNVSLTPLNNKGKHEKKVKKARQLLITFTIPQNNSTPVGEKTIYARVISPEGALLGGAGAFSFEDASVACSAKKSLEYEGAEVAGIHIYVDVNPGLLAGDYTVELFADNYRLCSKHFSLK